MTRITLNTLTFSVLLFGGVSACNPIGGVHLNSQVLQGRGSGVGLEPLSLTRGSRNAGADTERQNDTSGSTASWAASTEAAPGAADAPMSAIIEAPVVSTTEVASSSVTPPAPQPAPAPIVASAQSFAGQQTTVVGLGDPGRDGLWMETPLVTSRRNARLSAPNGKSVVVTLEPIAGDAGQGSRLSIDGMRALGLPLTELVEIRVGPA